MLDSFANFCPRIGNISLLLFLGYILFYPSLKKFRNNLRCIFILLQHELCILKLGFLLLHYFQSSVAFNIWIKIYFEIPSKSNQCIKHCKCFFFSFRHTPLNWRQAETVLLYMYICIYIWKPIYYIYIWKLISMSILQPDPLSWWFRLVGKHCSKNTN